MTDAPALLPILPELLLLVGAMALLMLGAFRGEGVTQTVYGAAIGLLVIDIAVVLWLPSGTLTTFNGSIVVDDFARFWKVLVLIGSAAAIALSLEYLAAVGQQKFEYAVLILLSATGMLLYGASLIYGFSGTVTYAGIAKAAGAGGIGLIFGLVFLFAGLCFKVSAVPFHMWRSEEHTSELQSRENLVC